jgi:hypothetical protein
VPAIHTSLTDRLRAHLADLGDEHLAALPRFATAAEHSTDAEIRGL